MDFPCRPATRFLLGVLATTAVIAACGSSNDATDAPSPDAGDETGSPADGSAGDVAPDSSKVPNADGPDVPPVAFPSTVPPLFGYTLVDAFPGTFLSGAMDMEWPAGSTQPFVLQRGGHIVRLHGD